MPLSYLGFWHDGGCCPKSLKKEQATGSFAPPNFGPTVQHGTGSVGFFSPLVKKQMGGACSSSRAQVSAVAGRVVFSWLFILAVVITKLGGVGVVCSCACAGRKLFAAGDLKFWPQLSQYTRLTEPSAGHGRGGASVSSPVHTTQED